MSKQGQRKAEEPLLAGVREKTLSSWGAGGPKKRATSTTTRSGPPGALVSRKGRRATVRPAGQALPNGVACKRLQRSAAAHPQWANQFSSGGRQAATAHRATAAQREAKKHKANPSAEQGDANREKYISCTAAIKGQQAPGDSATLSLQEQKARKMSQNSTGGI